MSDLGLRFVVCTLKFLDWLKHIHIWQVLLWRHDLSSLHSILSLWIKLWKSCLLDRWLSVWNKFLHLSLIIVLHLWNLLIDLIVVVWCLSYTVVLKWLTIHPLIHVLIQLVLLLKHRYRQLLLELVRLP